MFLLHLTEQVNAWPAYNLQVLIIRPGCTWH